LKKSEDGNERLGLTLLKKNKKKLRDWMKKKEKYIKTSKRIDCKDENKNR